MQAGQRLGDGQLWAGLAEAYEHECVGACGTIVEENKCLLEAVVCRK